jgi:predicted methyltransferase
MRQPLFRAALAAALSSATAGCATLSEADQTTQASYAALSAAIAAPHRTPANVARDPHRHPLETLSFFGVEPNDTVVEIWPGGGWYTEILAPYLAQGGGTYYAATPVGRGTERFQTFIGANPLYSNVRVANFPILGAAGGNPVPAGSADVVLTFRNVHNWMMGETPFAEDAFRQLYAMLKPGGTLGVVDHRLPESADSARERTSGYLKVSTVRRLAESAGFRFVGASEVNANPRDTADHANGVWSLPPTFRGGDVDREKYLAIGESDRMTLKFVKPAG